MSNADDTDRKPGPDECQRNFSAAKMKRKSYGSYPRATPVSPGCPSPIPGEALLGVLKSGKTIQWTILRFDDNGLKGAIWGG